MFDIICLQKHCFQTFFFKIVNCYFISLLFISLLLFSISSCFSFGRLHYPKDQYISSKLSFFFRHTLACVSLYYPLCFCGVHYSFSFFTSNFINFSPLPNFFLRNNSHYRFSYLSLLSLEICIQFEISFFFSIAFLFLLFSQLFFNSDNHFAFLYFFFLWDDFGHYLLYNIKNQGARKVFLSKQCNKT